jgi:hypothetical protein
MNPDEKVELLEKENALLKLQLEKYKSLHKKYYEENKEAVIEKANQRLKKLSETNPDKLKEYARRAYLKQKEKKKLAEESKSTENI